MEEAINAEPSRYKRKKAMFKYFTPLLGFLFPVVLFPVVLVLLLGFLFRLPWYRRYGSRFFDKRDESHGKRLSMNVEFTGPTWLVGWDIGFSGDGDHEHETKVSFWLIGRVWFTINNLFPKTWAPEYTTSKGEVMNWGTREYGFSIHDYSTWFKWWSHMGMGDQGYSWVVDFAQMIFGRISHNEAYWGHSYHKVSMSEGNYPCVVIRNEVTRGRARWFKRKYFSYEVVYGDFEQVGGVDYGYLAIEDPDGFYDHHYDKKLTLKKFDGRHYIGVVDPITTDAKVTMTAVGLVLDNKEVVPNSDVLAVLNNKGIPAPGKGTAGHNCGDTAFYSWSGLATSPHEAAIKAQNSIQKHRRNYGGETWVPSNEKYWEFKPKS